MSDPLSPLAGLAKRLERLSQRPADDVLKAHELLEGPRRAAFYFATVLLGALSALPTPGLPLGTFAGGVLFVLALAQLRGRRARLPGWLAGRSMPATLVARAARTLSRLLGRIPAAERPLAVRSHRRIAWTVAMLAAVVAAPIPFANTPAGVALAMLALGGLSGHPRVLWLAALAAVLGLAWPLVLLLGTFLGASSLLPGA